MTLCSFYQRFFTVKLAEEIGREFVGEWTSPDDTCLQLRLLGATVTVFNNETILINHVSRDSQVYQYLTRLKERCLSLPLEELCRDYRPVDSTAVDDVKEEKRRELLDVVMRESRAWQIERVEEQLKTLNEVVQRFEYVLECLQDATNLVNGVRNHFHKRLDELNAE